jgi:hypothetical protein
MALKKTWIIIATADLGFTPTSWVMLHVNHLTKFLDQSHDIVPLSHLIDEETEAQRGQIICLRSQSLPAMAPVLNPRRTFPF